MKTLARQRGMGLFQWLVVLAAAGFFLMFAFKVVPLYAENKYVISALRSIQDSGDRLSDMSDSEIRKKLENFYMINNVRSDGPTENIEIYRSHERILVTVDYETRVPFLWNIDLVLTFENHLNSNHVELCCSPLPSEKSVDE